MFLAGQPDGVNDGKPVAAPPVRFFVLVFALSVPFWLVGAFAAHAGVGLPFHLPLSALMLVCPVAAAAILTRRDNGPGAMRTLFKRAFDAGRISSRIWYLPMLLAIPAIYLLSSVVLRLMGRGVTPPTASAWATLVPLLVVSFFLASAEELGWMAYAFGGLQQRWGAFAASLVLGLVWALWHVIPDLQAHHAVQWIVGQRLYTVALRVLIVWIFNNCGGSVFAAATVHATEDVCYALTSAYYDPAVTAVITTITAGLVTLAWGPRTLAGLRRRRPRIPAGH